MDLVTVLLKWLQLVGLAALTGPAVIRLVWRQAMTQDDSPVQVAAVSILPRLSGLVRAGAAGLFVGAAADLTLRVQRVGGWPVAWDYVTGTHIGRALGLRAAVALIALARLALSHGQSLQWLLPLALVGAAGFSLVSHQAAVGWPATAGDFLHTAATAVWAGGLLGLSVLPWRGDRRVILPGAGGDRAWSQLSVPVISAFSRLATGAVLTLAATGALAGMANIAGLQGLTGDIYGQTLLRKLALFALLLVVAALNHFWLVPNLRRSGPAGPPADALWVVAFLVRLEAVLVLGIILLAALLSGLPPPVAA